MYTWNEDMTYDLLLAGGHESIVTVLGCLCEQMDTQKSYK